tara:strand:+ start:114 stop:365 length:252 start_codon:yes stop_codon:yes gene_type:complete
MIKQYSHIEEDANWVEFSSHITPARAIWWPESARLYVDTVEQLSPFTPGRDIINGVKTEQMAEKIYRNYEQSNAMEVLIDDIG